MSEETCLRIHGRGALEVGDVSRFLLDLENAYNAIYAFDEYVRYERPHYYERPYAVIRGAEPLISWLTGRRRVLPKANRVVSLAEVTNMVDQGRSFVPQTNRIKLKGVILHSPGAWDFLGTLNPLEVIRKYLNDKHERQKDRDYRSPFERRKLELENLSLETKVIRERIELAREAGIPENQITYIVSELLEAPLRQLGTHEEKGVIGWAEIVDRDESSESGRYDE